MWSLHENILRQVKYGFKWIVFQNYHLMRSKIFRPTVNARFTVCIWIAYTIKHFITCSKMDPLQWMGAIRMGVQTADKNITSNPHHSSHQLRFCEEKSCVCKKQITHEGALSPWSIIMLSLINMSRRDRFSLNNKCNLLIFYGELSLQVCACSYALKRLFYIYVSTL